MIYDDFLKVLRDLFPSLYDDSSRAAIDSIRQFYKNKEHYTIEGKINEDVYPQLVNSPIPDVLSQGDIVSEIPFYYIDDDGDLAETTNKGIILSSSCDIENDEKILISPCFTLSDLENFEKSTLIKNMKFNFFCLNNSPDESNCLCANFSMISSYSKSLIVKKIQNNEIQRLHSLTPIGYYLLIIKLCVHLLRKEDSTLMNKR